MKSTVIETISLKALATVSGGTCPVTNDSDIPVTVTPEQGGPSVTLKKDESVGVDGPFHSKSRVGGQFNPGTCPGGGWVYQKRTHPLFGGDHYGMFPKK